MWDYDFAGNASVLETYISYLRHKIDHVDPPLIHTVRGVGYSLRLPPGHEGSCIARSEGGDLGHQLVRAHPVLEAVDHRRDHQLVRRRSARAALRPARTVAGLPTTCEAVQPRIISRSNSVYGYAAASSGVG